MISVDPLGQLKISRDGLEITIPGSLAGTSISEQYPNMIVTIGEYQGFIFATDDYDLGDGCPYPRAGDLIERANGQKFRVIPLMEDQTPPYEFILSDRSRVRVHTIKVED